jgi:hypothetical protein
MFSNWEAEKDRYKSIALLRVGEICLFGGVLLTLGSIWGSLLVSELAQWPLGIVFGTVLGFGGYYTANRMRRKCDQFEVPRRTY